MNDGVWRLKLGRRHTAKTHGYRVGDPVPEEVSFRYNTRAFIEDPRF